MPRDIAKIYYVEIDTDSLAKIIISKWYGY